MGEELGDKMLTVAELEGFIRRDAEIYRRCETVLRAMKRFRLNEVVHSEVRAKTIQQAKKGSSAPLFACFVSINSGGVTKQQLQRVLDTYPLKLFGCFPILYAV